MNKIQYFNIEQASNDKRNIKAFELENKIKMVLISDPNLNTSSCSVAVGAGHLHDEFPGTAHFLEHLLFMGNEKYKEQNEYHSYIQVCGGSDNAFTGDNITCYYLNLETTFLKKGIEMLSWFFRAPLLDEKHILSEMEIIDSEHNKNILSENWIVDDIFKNFIQNNSKYTKFGTGNIKSLKSITKKDIMDFYDKYYTTDNLFVCIVDSKNIDIMMNEYVDYFNDIPIKISNFSFVKEDLNLKKDNLIFYKSNSEYLFANFYLIFNSDKTNLYDYQLIYLIEYLFGCEYVNSLVYHLKENDYIKSSISSLEYFYDNSSNICLKFILNNESKNNFCQIYYSLIKYLKKLQQINQKDFEDIYLNYKKIELLKLLYNTNSDPIAVSNEIVENMTLDNIKLSVIRKLFVPAFDKNIWNKFINMISDVIIKITTNFNFEKISNDLFIKSTWYESHYYLTKFNLEKYVSDNNFKLLNFDFVPLNIIGIKDFIIKQNIFYEINKKSIPQLIFKNEIINREIYLDEINKYDKPISNISVIRKNKNLLDKENKIISSIYIELCYKLLNYYIETMSSYKLFFNINISKDSLIINFNGLNYIIEQFISNIMNTIHPDNIFFIANTEKYFNDIIRDIKDNIANLKYLSPYVLCSKYFSYQMDNSMLPTDRLTFINNLTFEKFKNKIIDCFKYTYEYYILIGIKKNGNFSNIINNGNYEFVKDIYLNNIIDQLSFGPKKYLIDNNLTYNWDLIYSNYKLEKSNINSKEINNCLIKYWDIDKIQIDFSKYKLSSEDSHKLIKCNIIYSFVAEILNEPLFDRIRTINKLGYIVKSDVKSIINSNQVNYIIYFLIQSSFSIDRINIAIDDFISFIQEDIEVNEPAYFEKFKLLKQSKIIDLEKPFPDLASEVGTYLESIITNIKNFNLNELYLDICKQIDFDDIKIIIEKIANNKFKHYNLYLDKNVVSKHKNYKISTKNKNKKN